MRHREKNGLHYVNLCTSAYTTEYANEFVKKVRAEAHLPESRYMAAFHERGFIWVAVKSDNVGRVKA